MTDREAIDVLFNEWKCIDRNDGIHCDRKCESCDLVMDVGIIREAFNMAISALQAQEAKTQLSAEGTTSDLISRQAAIDAIFSEPLYESGMKKRDADTVVPAIYEKIKSLPSAQTERKKGKWIFYETENERYDDIKCPFCKKTYTVDPYRIDDIGFTAEDFKFCPNCGAEMKASGKE
jgi:hypothetical protein